MTRYTATTPDDRAAMLAAIGVGSVQELFERQIPPGVRMRGALALPEGLPEQEVYEHLRALAARNVSAEEELCFLGAGMYDHYVPSLIDMLMERSEWLTPYTPYQPEVSQGGLQVMFEYQTAISELTALPVSNASVYEGPSAVASAAYMAKLHNARPRIVVSAGLHPHTLQTLRTYAHGFGATVVEVPLVGGAGGSGIAGGSSGIAGGGSGIAGGGSGIAGGGSGIAGGGSGIAGGGSGIAGGGSGIAGGAPRLSGAGGHVTDLDAWSAAIDGRTSAAIFAQPNLYGAVEDAPALSAAARAAGGEQLTVISQVDPVTLGVLAAPGECGVDVAVGEGQSLGNRLDFGGPSFGFFAAREQYLRRMPGRIAGETLDVDGRRGFVLTLQTREQHIRREKATSNICTSQALNALAGVVYLGWLGRRGLVELGELLLARTHYARQSLACLPGVELLHDRPVVREFALRLTAPRHDAGDVTGDGADAGGDGADAGGGRDADVAAVRRYCAERGVNPGADLYALTGREEDRGGLLVALTERRSRADIDRLAGVLGAAVAAVAAEREAVTA